MPISTSSIALPHHNPGLCCDSSPQSYCLQGYQNAEDTDDRNSEHSVHGLYTNTYALHVLEMRWPIIYTGRLFGSLPDRMTCAVQRHIPAAPFVRRRTTQLRDTVLSAGTADFQEYDRRGFLKVLE